MVEFWIKQEKKISATSQCSYVIRKKNNKKKLEIIREALDACDLK